MNKSIEKYIPQAMIVINNFRNPPAPATPRTLKKEYKGYLSSFGASIIMSGLIPTLAFYANADSKSDRKEVLKWMFEVLKTKDDYRTATGENLFVYALDLTDSQKQALEKELRDISIALKLSIRTFPLS